MKNRFPTLAPLLRSDAQGLLLARLYLDPEREWTLSELSGVCGASVASVMRDVDRLIEADYLLERRVGRSRLVKVNTSHQLTRAVTELVLYAYGPQPVIHNLLDRVPGVDRAFIFGSWAARIQGVSGPNPNDVDVLVVGEVSMRRASDISLQATSRLHRETNVQVVSLDAWNSTSSAFLRNVKAGPLVEIDVSR